MHQLVDGHGLPLATILSPGQAHDAPVLIPLVDQIKVPRLHAGRARTRPVAVRGDKAYSSKAIRAYLRNRGITAVIAEPDQKRNRKNRGSRGGLPPAFDAESYKGRNDVERGFGHLKQWRGIATRYDKLAMVFRSAVQIHGEEPLKIVAGYLDSIIIFRETRRPLSMAPSMNPGQILA